MSTSQLATTLRVIESYKLTPALALRAYIKLNPLTLSMADMESLYDLMLTK